MSNTIKDLKATVFVEWSYDPPGGTTSFYYCGWSDKYEDLMWIFDESYEHLSECIDGEDAGKLIELLADKNESYSYFKEFCYSNGGVGIESLVVAEGDAIAQAVIDFIYENLSDFIVDDFSGEGEVDQEKEAILTAAENAPNDYNAVIALLELLQTLIEDYNESCC